MAYFGKGGRGPSETGTAAAIFGMLAEVRAYWQGLRQDGALPRRDDIDPRGIAGALENTFLLERVAPGVARFRLAGMQLHDLMGMDVRGMPLTALIEPGGRGRMGDALEAIFAGPGTLEVWCEAERGLGRPALEARMLLLPLSTGRATVDLALGCLAIHGDLGRTPRRFAISGLVGEKLTITPPQITPPRAAAAAVTPAVAQRQAVAGLAEMGTSFMPAFAPRPPRGKPNLRLVHSRD